MADEATPDTPSSDYKAMQDYWDKVDVILGGIAELRKAKEKYLPKFPEEMQERYDFRIKNTKFTNVFRDILENLTAKPFGEKVDVAQDAPQQYIDVANDIDGQGNNLHVFAQSVLFNGIASAIDWIMVDWPVMPAGMTLADERNAGAKPYWARIDADDMIAVYSACVKGEEIFVHARFKECVTVRNGFAETESKRVRVLNRDPIIVDGSIVDYGPATWEVWELQNVQDGAGQTKPQWVRIQDGVFSIGIIPIHPFIAGRRDEGTWRILPPMQDAVDLQIELYQQESGLKHIRTMACFPMLAAIGVNLRDDQGKEIKVPIGPMRVLNAPPHGDGRGTAGDWKFIEPSAESLKFLAADIQETIQQLRELGRQPLTAQTGNLTVVTTAFAAEKANSVIQAWALNLKDCLERCLQITAMWLGDDPDNAPAVQIQTEFAVSINDDKTIDALLAMRAARDISQQTLWEEMRNRNVLSSDFDSDAEPELLANEGPGDGADLTAYTDASGMTQPNDPQQ